jgi:hypothetical protein
MAKDHIFAHHVRPLACQKEKQLGGHTFAGYEGDGIRHSGDGDPAVLGTRPPGVQAGVPRAHTRGQTSRRTDSSCCRGSASPAARPKQIAPVQTVPHGQEDDKTKAYRHGPNGPRGEDRPIPQLDLGQECGPRIEKWIAPVSSFVLSGPLGSDRATDPFPWTSKLTRQLHALPSPATTPSGGGMARRTMHDQEASSSSGPPLRGSKHTASVLVSVSRRKQIISQTKSVSKIGWPAGRCPHSRNGIYGKE